MLAFQRSSFAPVELNLDPHGRCGMKVVALMIGAVLGLMVVSGIVDALARIEWVGFAAVLLIVASLVAVIVVMALDLLHILSEEP